jgi:hypothetical protein
MRIKLQTKSNPVRKIINQIKLNTQHLVCKTYATLHHKASAMHDQTKHTGVSLPTKTRSYLHKDDQVDSCP